MRSMLRVVTALALTLIPLGAAAAPLDTVSDSFAITNVRVFDGSEVIPLATVVVLDGQISAVGANAVVPLGVPTIDGSGMTLMPGMIDGHAHARSRQELERAAVFGVTTEMDMWSTPQFARSARREQERNGAPYRADHLSAINPATTPEGYPYNITPHEQEKPTLSSPEEAEEFVADLARLGANHLKIMIEDGSWTGFNLQVLSRATVQALTRETRERGMLAVAHVTEIVHARSAIEDGVDGLVHTFIDELADPTFLQLAAANGIFLAGTLSAEEAFVTNSGGASLVVDPELGPYLTLAEEVPPIRRPLSTPDTSPFRELVVSGRSELSGQYKLLVAGCAPVFSFCSVRRSAPATHRDQGAGAGNRLRHPWHSRAPRKSSVPRSCPRLGTAVVSYPEERGASTSWLATWAHLRQRAQRRGAGAQSDGDGLNQALPRAPCCPAEINQKLARLGTAPGRA